MSFNASHLPAYTPPAPARLKSPAGLATALTVLFAVVIMTDLLAVAAGLNVHFAYSSPAVGDAEATRAQTLHSFSGGPQMLAFLVTGVVFIVWFRRVRGNAEVFLPGGLRMRPGWSVGCWFIPIANLWLPYQNAVDIWGASTQAAPGGQYRHVSAAPVNAWWAVYVGGLLFARFAVRAYEAAETADEVVSGVRLVIAGDLLDAVAAVLALLFVRKLTAMQHRKATEGPVAAA
ncbi:DUF4328 domain-containing protein [Streptomyces sp. NPDC086023]|uniref:DUF4328 domain-containing protein n=1 Tax=Streptomyces sp. NPDC086023 TaxID=3365746 RepID=UPI0037CD8CC6